MWFYSVATDTQWIWSCYQMPFFTLNNIYIYNVKSITTWRSKEGKKWSNMHACIMLCGIYATSHHPHTVWAINDQAWSPHLQSFTPPNSNFLPFFAIYFLPKKKFFFLHFICIYLEHRSFNHPSSTHLLVLSDTSLQTFLFVFSLLISTVRTYAFWDHNPVLNLYYIYNAMISLIFTNVLIPCEWIIRVQYVTWIKLN